MANISIRLSDSDRMKIEHIIKSTGNLYKTSDIIGAAISMIDEHGTGISEKTEIAGKSSNLASFLFSLCADLDSYTLIRDIEVENSSCSCVYKKGTYVRLVPPNILEFGASDKLSSRIYIYPDTRFYSVTGVLLEYETLKPETSKIKMVLIEDSL